MRHNALHLFSENTRLEFLICYPDRGSALVFHSVQVVAGLNIVQIKQIDNRWIQLYNQYVKHVWAANPNLLCLGIGDCFPVAVFKNEL